MPSTDADLIRQCLDGDDRAFAVLVERHGATVWQAVREIVGDAADVEDVVQESFISAYRALPGFRGEAQFRTWLLRIAHNAAVTRAQQRARRRESAFPQDEEEAGADAFPSSEKLPDELLDAKVLEEHLAQLIDGLPDHYRVVLVLYYYEQLTYEEIAEVVGRPINTVKAHIRRAKIRLGELVGAEFVPGE
jgi:RNA polymerase sigma-70 factor (ECF subfamily)